MGYLKCLMLHFQCFLLVGMEVEEPDSAENAGFE